MHIGLIGATNVGKSTLFNRLIRQFRAIVTDIHGTTQDIIHQMIERDGTTIDVADSPGLGSFTEELPFIERLIKESDLLFFVLDEKVGITAKEQQIHELVMRHHAKEKVIVVVNKVDRVVAPKDRPIVRAPFYALGYETILDVSAKQGKNIDELRELVDERIMGEKEEERKENKNRKEEESSVVPAKMQKKEPQKVREDVLVEEPLPTTPVVVARDELPLDSDIDATITNTYPDQSHKTRNDGRIHLAIVGRPNAGKSTLLNTIVGDYMSKVQDTPGTTLDYISTEIEMMGNTYMLYDTAGIRKKSKARGLEAIAYEKTVAMLKYSKPAVVFMIDGTEGLSHRDQTLLEEMHNIGVPIMIALNKVDVLTPIQIKTVHEYIADHLLFAKHIPIINISAKSGKGIDDIFRTVYRVWKASFQRITTGELNKIVHQAFIVKPPRFPKNKTCKILYLTQADLHPQIFKVFINHLARANFSFKKWLENVIRKAFPFEGCPLYIDFVERKRDEARTRGKNSPRRYTKKPRETGETVKMEKKKKVKELAI